MSAPDREERDQHGAWERGRRPRALPAVMVHLLGEGRKTCALAAVLVLALVDRSHGHGIWKTLRLLTAPSQHAQLCALSEES